MNSREIARECVQLLNVLNALAQEGKPLEDVEVQIFLRRYYEELQKYHRATEKKDLTEF